MKYRINLQIFGEGGEGGAPAAPGGEAGGQAAGTQVAAGKQSRNSLSGVKYGIQDGGEAESDAASGGEPSNNVVDVPVDKKAEFERLIKEDYKEQFDERVRSILEKRFRTQDEIVARQKQMEPIMEILAQKYGVNTKDGVDIEKLTKAIYEDDAYYEQEALEKGIPVEALKELKRMERENAQMKTAMAERQKQDANRQAYQELLRQSEEVKKIYPGFDLAKEMQNPDFGRLIAANVDARAAYEVVHRDEIQPAMAQYVAQRTAEKIANNIKSGVGRPMENGASSSGPAVTKTDVTKLTKADRAEIMRRVALGEKIKF